MEAEEREHLSVGLEVDRDGLAGGCEQVEYQIDGMP